MKICLTALAMLTATMLLCAEDVKLTTSDNKVLHGILAGKGSTALVLCHGRGYKNGANSFSPQLEFFSSQGMMCLALSFRGYPAERVPDFQRNRELDIVAACNLLKGKGVESIYVLGSSMGGFTTLRTMEQLSKIPQVKGIIILSAYAQIAVNAPRIRKLFVVAKDDRSCYKMTLETFNLADQPKQLIRYKEGGHGQSLFDSQPDLTAQIAAFVKNEQKEGEK